MFSSDTMNGLPRARKIGAAYTLVFVGGALEFPNTILRLVEQEAGGARALRLESLNDLRQLSLDRQHLVRNVVFDDRLATDVFANFDQYRGYFPGANWILAYRDPAIARHLLDERLVTPRLAPVLLLPMTLPICPWTSMLRLVLAGQFIAAGELISPTSAETAHASTAADKARQQMQSDIPEGPPSGRPVSGVGLTQREKEVLAWVSQGGRNKSIAHSMLLSEHTVKLHLHNAITKIGARNRTEAATWYLSNHAGEQR